MIHAIVQNALSNHDVASQDEATADDHRPVAILSGITAERPDCLPVDKILAIVREAWSKAGHCGAGRDDGSVADVHLVGVSRLPVDLF
ncbi:MAG: hypothetical protein HP496_17125 [Nitrospira sp.]|nr:hypothetical protein [Nitrospira sp.]